MQKRRRIQPVQRFVQRDLPMSFPFISDKIYVRECYLVYYDLIIECLRNEGIWFISLTGTPGIGKSVFLIYFFERYREENAGVTIIVASFDKARTLKECKEYAPGKAEPISHSSVPRKDENCLYLFDGPPNFAPVRRKMVCFTSPNHTWLYNNERDESHKVLYFPLWSLDELDEANSLCNLGIATSDLESRFGLFGGSARYCLTQQSKSIKRGSDGLHAKILSVDSFDKLSMCLKNETADSDFSHHLFHSVPQIDDEFPFVDFEQRIICSNQVLKLILDRIREKSDANRSDLISSIKGISKFSSFRGTIFEEYAHDVLRSGGAFQLRPLSENIQNVSLQLSTGNYRPTKVGQESVDGVFVDGDIVYLFQVTISLTHPLTAHGLLETLKQVEKWQDYRDGKITLRLVFVVAKENEDLNAQRIQKQKSISWDSPISEMLHLRTTWKEELLATHGHISAMHLLKLARDDPKSGEKFTRALRDFRARIENLPLGSQIMGIPQYRLVLSEFDDNSNPINQSREALLAQIKLLTETIRKFRDEMKKPNGPKGDEEVGG